MDIVISCVKSCLDELERELTIVGTHLIDYAGFDDSREFQLSGGLAPENAEISYCFGADAMGTYGENQVERLRQADGPAINSSLIETQR